MNKSLLKELLELTPAERIKLAQDLWDSIEPHEMTALTLEQEQEFERRYAEHIRNPESASEWDDVKKRLLARLAE
jgi:putative addiction module component (TIGR02574 family)